MMLPRDAMLLRVFFGENDRFQGRPLYEAIVLKARAAHIAGATVLRGPMGFGHSSRIHTTKILRLSEDLPLIVEIVDTEEKIKSFLPVLDFDDVERARHPGEGAGLAIWRGREARAGLMALGADGDARDLISIILAGQACGNRCVCKAWETVRGQDRKSQRARNSRFARQSDNTRSCHARRRDRRGLLAFHPEPRPERTKRSSFATATKNATAARAS